MEFLRVWSVATTVQISIQLVIGGRRPVEDVAVADAPCLIIDYHFLDPAIPPVLSTAAREIRFLMHVEFRDLNPHQHHATSQMLGLQQGVL